MIYQIRNTTEEKSLEISAAFLQKQNSILPFRFALLAPERMFDLHPETSRINCNIRAGAFVSIACALKQHDVLKMYTPKKKIFLQEKLAKAGNFTP